MAEARQADPSRARGAAAAQRALRAAQARWLAADDGARASAATLSAIAWDDLGRLPDWSTGDAAALDRLVAHLGAWAHAATLRQCIDGRLLAALRARLDDGAFAALMAGDEAAATRPNELPLAQGVGPTLAAMDQRARELLLGSIADGALREAVRERVWPDAPPLLRPEAAAEALALVARVRRHLDGVAEPAEAADPAAPATGATTAAASTSSHGAPSRAQGVPA